MKLHTKVITAFTPLAVLGVSIPAITSCSCNNDPYSINYGQDINCLYSNKDGYKSLNAVQDAVKSHADVHEEGDITQAQLNTAGSIWCKNEGDAQSLYFDFIASYTIMEQKPIYLTDWSAEYKEQEKAYTFNFNYELSETEKYVGYSIMYGHNDNNKVTMSIMITEEGSVTGDTILSYRFKDCTFKEGE